jgi:hypothetical protein
MKRVTQIFSKRLQLICVFAYLFLIANIVHPQSGGPFEIKESVIGGGGNSSVGDDFALDSTSGQATAGGEVRGGLFSATSGFWTYTPLLPTAAPVAIGGRVTTPEGYGIGNVRITLTSLSGETQSIITSAFGFYRFENVIVGQTYIVSVSAKQFTFNRSSVAVSVVDEIIDLNFVANPR